MAKSQDDFDLLKVSDACNKCEQDQIESDSEEILAIKRLDEKYVPVNFIPESVYALIKAWQDANKSTCTNLQ